MPKLSGHREESENRIIVLWHMLAFRRQRQEDFCEFEASRIYIVNSMTAKAM